MRFVSLDVSWFQGVKSARLEFGSGLNVLYGPNDLGKSSLAMAMRAALLLPTGAAEAQAFQPWTADEKATVTLVFVDHDGKFWKVRKTFGGPSGAQLWFSKDGTSWSPEAKAREVDEKLRALLPWGIPAPGGKGAPRGLPESFLRNALLGEQDRVDTILDIGLDNDPADSGKMALTAALSALAQDPQFKKVLLAAQGQFDRFFTEKGKLKTGQTSPITLMSDAVKKLQVERDTLRKTVDDAQHIEKSARDLQERRVELAATLDAAKARLLDIQKRLARSQARQAVVDKVKGVEDELAKVDAHSKRVKSALESVGELTKAVSSKQTALTVAATAKEAAEAALRTAEERLWQLTNGADAKQRELERAQIDAKVAKLGEERRELDARQASAASAADAQGELANARGRMSSLSAEAAALAAAREQAVNARAQAEHDLELAEGIVAYGRWRVACDSAESAAKAQAEATRLKLEATAREEAAKEHEARAAAALGEADEKQSVLPTAEQLFALKRLERDREVAEAALGGGVTVTVRPRSGIAFNSIADDGSPVALASLSTELVIEAERNILLSIAKLAEVEVIAGAPEKRRALEGLRRRWKAEAVPWLEKAAAASLADLEIRLAALSAYSTVAKEEGAKARSAKSEAAGLRDKASLLERQTPPAKEDLQAKEQRIGALPREVLAKFYMSMGSTWEAQCEELRTTTTKKARELQESVAKIESNQKQADWSLQEAKTREQEVSARLRPLLEALGEESPAAVRAKVQVALDANSTAVKEHLASLAPLSTGGSSAVEFARKSISDAQDAIKSRNDAAQQAQQALTEAQAQLHARHAEVKLLQEQLTSMNRAEIEARFAEASGELNSFGVSRGTSEFDVRNAQAEVAKLQGQFDQVNEEFHKVDGALTSVAGPMMREKVQQLEEAIISAQARERELVVDAEAWRLLRDALREAEKTESAHLGKALAPPVAQRFKALTQGKYAGVALDQALRTESVVVAGVPAEGDVLNALSVGTKDQLATLVRLAVATQLKSAILLDDQLVHTDPKRLVWFADVLRKVADESQLQILVFTCRPLDYVKESDLPSDEPVREIGPIHVVDLSQIVRASN